jgi:hypothetical protein
VQKESGEWSTRVVECEENEQSDLDALDIPSLLRTSGLDTIDVLKVDIEGAEKILFSRDYESWIDHVHIIAIELHGPTSRKIFLEALQGRNFDLSTSGELMIARRSISD